MHKIYIGTQAKCTKYILGHKHNAQNDGNRAHPLTLKAYG